MRRNINAKRSLFVITIETARSLKLFPNPPPNPHFLPAAATENLRVDDTG